MADVADIEMQAFRETWQDIADAAERGLADPDYPDDRRPALYQLLGAARSCAGTDMEWGAR